MLGFHLASLKAYGSWFILSSFVQGRFIAKGWRQASRQAVEPGKI